MTAAAGMTVCDGCDRRTWLLGALAGHLDVARTRIGELLALGDNELIAAVAGRDEDPIRGALAELDPGAGAAARAAAGVLAVCRCAPGYPDRLRDLPCPPAVLHLLGGLGLAELGGVGTVAIVGARRPSPYGRQVAGELAGGCARAGLEVVSGLALGVDARAHAGALDVGGTTVAVMPGGVDRVYPAAHRRLRARLGERGAAVSELAVGVSPRRWMFPARNRIIAALASMTVVVQAREGSGALLTAGWAGAIGRITGAVPGQVTLAQSAGPHRLLRGGARLVTGVGDVLDALYGVDRPPLPPRRPPPPDPPLDAVLAGLADGLAAQDAGARAGLDVAGGLAALASLELSGHVRRDAGGGWEVVG